MSSIQTFEEELEKISLSFTKKNDSYEISMYKKNYDKFEAILRKNGMKFSVRDTDTYDKVKRRILWSSAVIPFIGTPFVIEKVQYMQCENGPKYFNRNNKNASSEKLENSAGKPKRFRLQPSKKVGCSATMKVTISKRYSDFCITGKKNAATEKREIMKKLKKQLQNDSVVTETIYYISFSAASQHCHSAWVHNETSVVVPSPSFDSPCSTVHDSLSYKSLSHESLVDESLADDKCPSDTVNEDIISSAVVPLSESESSAKSSVSISEFREIMKNLYDCSFLLKGDYVDPSLKKQAIKMFNLMDPYIDIDNQLNISIFPFPASDLPSSEK